MAGSNTVQRRVASALARYIAMSALRSSSPAWSLPGWLRAMPTLAPTDTSPEDRRTGSASASSIRPAKVRAWCSSWGTRVDQDGGSWKAWCMASTVRASFRARLACSAKASSTSCSIRL